MQNYFIQEIWNYINDKNYTPSILNWIILEICGGGGGGGVDNIDPPTK